MKGSVCSSFISQKAKESHDELELQHFYEEKMIQLHQFSHQSVHMMVCCVC